MAEDFRIRTKSLFLKEEFSSLAALMTGGDLDTIIEERGDIDRMRIGMSNNLKLVSALASEDTAEGLAKLTSTLQEISREIRTNKEGKEKDIESRDNTEVPSKSSSSSSSGMKMGSSIERSPSSYATCKFNIAVVYFKAHRILESKQILADLFHLHIQEVDPYIAFKISCLYMDVLFEEWARLSQMDQRKIYEAHISQISKIINFIEKNKISCTSTEIQSSINAIMKCRSELYKARSMAAFPDFNFEENKTSAEAEKGGKGVAKIEKKKEDTKGTDVSYMIEKCYSSLKEAEDLTPPELLEDLTLSFCESPLRSLSLSHIRKELKFIEAKEAFQSGLYEDAMLKLSESNTEKVEGDGKDAAYYNNMANTYLMMGKPKVATLLYTKALKDCVENRKHVRGLSASPRGVNILYNMGLALMNSANFVDAFKCFGQALQGSTVNELHLVRMAECCIQQDYVDKSNAARDQNTNVKSIGRGPSHRIFLGKNPTLVTRSIKVNTIGFEMNLDNAICLLYSAFNLCNSHKHHSKKYDWDGEKLLEKGMEKIEIDEDENEGYKRNLKKHILLQLAYLHLCQENYTACLKNTNEIRSMHLGGSDEDKKKKFLSDTYSVEALCGLGRVDEAITLMGDLNWISNETSGDSGSAGTWSGDIDPPLSDADTMKLGILVNRSAVLCLSGKLDEAETMLRQTIRVCPNHNALTRNLIYVLLRQGRSDAALEVLRNHRR